MVKSFKCGNTCASKTERETLETIEKLLQLHGLETSALIHQYYVERHRQQENMSDSPFGMLTIRCSISDNYLDVKK